MMKKFYYYIYYRLYKYYENDANYDEKSFSRTAFSILFWFNLSTIIVIFTDFVYFLGSFQQNGEQYDIRENVVPFTFLISPLVFLFVYFYIKINKLDIEKYFLIFNQEDEIKRKKGRLYIGLYMVISFFSYFMSWTLKFWF